MASSGNFASINFQAQSTKSQVVPNESNLTFNGSGLSPSNYEGGVVCDFGMKSGKWYWETYLHGGGTPVSGRDWNVGFAPYSTASKSVDEGTYGLFLGNGSSSTLSGYGYTQYPSGTMGVRHNNSTSSFGSAHSSGDVLGHALDLDNGTWIIYKNGSSLGTAATGIDTSFTYFAAGGAQGGNVSSFDVTFNFGQDSTFKGAISAGGNADGNGFGDFKYSVPSGYLACSTANLSISDDIDPAQTDDDYPSKQFDTVLYTGNASTNNITGLNFQPDLVWIKIRNTASNAVLVDSLRGTNKMIHPNNTDVEVTTANLTSFNSNGFSLDGTSNYQANYNGNGNTYVAWCWRANGGTTASNSNGAISSTVQANQAAGFSIVQWTANATSSVATTVGHGLSKAPEFVITKSRDSAGNWCVTHTGLSSPSHMLFLNSNASPSDKSGNGSMSANTSTVFSVNATDGSNSPNGDNMIAYCWHSVEGYSKFGSYTGNSNNDGPFIYTGFRPRMVFLKLRDSAGDWWIYDSARDTANPVNKYISWNRTDAEASGLNADFLSNGFKLRNTSGDFNSSATILYGAWGDVPWKYNNTF